MIVSIDNLFSFLNFLVVCIGAVYILKRYGISYIVISMKLQEHKQEEQIQEYNNLLQQCDLIKLEVQKQETLYVNMKEKFYFWQSKTQQKSAAKKAALLDCKEKLQKKELAKMQSLQHKQIIKEEMPVLLKEISDSLESKFEQKSSLQKEYTAQLIKFILER